MKKLLVIAIASLGLIVSQANASVVIALDAASLLQGGSGSALSTSDTLVLMIIDTGNNGINTADLSTGQLIGLGSSIGDDLIIARFDMGVGGDGYVSGTTEFTATAGQKLGIIWLNGNTIGNAAIGSQTTLGNGIKYGSLINTTPSYGDSWAVPADTQSINMSLLTPDDAEALGYATHNIVGVPEPSTITLVGLGMLGMLRLLRRRS